MKVEIDAGTDRVPTCFRTKAGRTNVNLLRAHMMGAAQIKLTFDHVVTAQRKRGIHDRTHAGA